MDKDYLIPFMGSIPSLCMEQLERKEDYPLLAVFTYDFGRRYTVQISDSGMDGQGISAGDYLIFREQRWPTSESEICLVTFGDEVTVRIVEFIYNPEITLRVTRDQIPPIELAPTDFAVIGVLSNVIKQDLARLVHLDLNNWEEW